MAKSKSGIEAHTSDSSRFRKLLIILAAAAFGLGAFFRFWGIGAAPLAVDEYFFGTSILNAAEHWLPEFACGGLYTRGLLIQYMSLPLLSAGASIEFTTRFWPAVASLLSIAAVWRLGRLAGGIRTATVAVILVSFSVWETEFARFGRMYSPFQAVFLWYVYFQILHLIQNSNRARWTYLALSAISIFVYAGASFLLVFNFLALVWPGKRWTIGHLIMSIILLVAGVSFYSGDFRFLGVPSDAAPPVTQSESALSLPINIPALPEMTLPIVAIGLLLIGLVLWRYRRDIRLSHPSIIYWMLTTACACFGLVGLSFGLLLAGVLMRLPPPVSEARLKTTVTLRSIVALFAVWFGIIAGLFALDGGSAWAVAKNSLMYTVNYPDLYYHVVRPWFRTIPVTTVLLVLLAAMQMWFLLVTQRGRASEALNVQRFLAAAVILLALLSAIFKQPYAITRYTYFLYPIILLLAATAVVYRFTSRFDYRPMAIAATLFPITVLFLFAEDFRLNHLLRINEPEVRYRSMYDEQLAMHYYLRWDFRTASYFVNDRLSPSDSVIVFDQPLPHYLNRTSGIFIRAGTENHTLVWGCGGTRDLWSNAPLLDTESEVHELIAETTGNVWLITRTEAYRFRDPLETLLPERYGLQPEYVTEDGHLAVYRLPADGQR